MLQMSQESEPNHFNGIATGDESWFRYFYPCSKMSAQSPAEVIPRTRQAIGAQQTIITVFLAARRLIVLDVLPKCSKFNQLHLADYFSILQSENPDFCRRVPQLTSWPHIDTFSPFIRQTVGN
jgi:hypothetical protein